MRYLLSISFLAVATFSPAATARQLFLDETHFSKVFGENRTYRIVLPPDYETSGKSYPVIYYFHGHSDRYTLEKYDDGKDTLPKIVDFVSKHDVIVVSVDGYVARDYTGFYGGTPWDVMRDGGDYDFGVYFQELVSHVDKTYRTLTDRRHRATSGLSMGGFMSLYLSARLPQLLGSASAFNPGPEFHAGDKGRRVLWRPKDHVTSQEHSMIRLVCASGDYIRQYHEETRDAYARADAVDFEYRQDEYHRHWATSIGETFDFHVRAFANPKLDNTPESWSHANPYKVFEAWGYRVETQGDEAGFTCLQDVTQGGLRLTTRRWAPDGPALANRKITVVTAPLYSAEKTYTLLDYSLSSGKTSRQSLTADHSGRLTFTVDGAGRQISLLGPGTGAQPPVLLPLTPQDKLRCLPQKEISLPIRIYNPRGEAMKNVKVVLSSEYPTVELLKDSYEIASLDSGAVADISRNFRLRFTSGGGYFAPARLRLSLTYDGWLGTSENLDVLIIPEQLAAPAGIEILDGRTVTFHVFHQKGNQGGGSSIERTVTEGKGNGNGVLEPGEEATIWVKMPQGMDPFDKGNWYRCKIYSDSSWLAEIGDIQEDKQREWTGGQDRTSLIRLAANTPSGSQIPLTLDNETWSFHFTPDVQYGPQKLYQAFQLHTRHLHQYQLKVP